MLRMPWEIVGGVAVAALAALAVVGTAGAAESSAAGAVEKLITDLDTRYQAAVERNDAAAMAEILDDNFVLVLGDGRRFDKEDLLEKARTREVIYEKQVDRQQKVEVYGDTAIITALLHEKGTKAGQPFELELWFSDVYIRTPHGWRYVFGQASLPLPK